MTIFTPIFCRASLGLGLFMLLAACGDASGPDGKKGPAVGSRAQTITFAAAPVLPLGGGATVSATASSGLPLIYGSHTPTVCRVEASSDTAARVTALTPGTCTVSARQDGNATWAAVRATLDVPVLVNPTQTITFGPAPALKQGDTATAIATASSGLPVRYTSLTPATCTVDADSGLVTALLAGTCTLAADQAGDAHYQPAAQATLSLTVAAAPPPQLPGKPAQLSARAGADGSATVEVTAAQIDAGGLPIVQYRLTSTPAGIAATSPTLPVTAPCPAGDCSGRTLHLQAVSAAGPGPVSDAVDMITSYKVHQIHDEPDYTHIDTEFRGQFTYNASTRTVSGLQGDLSEVMSGLDQPGQPWPMKMPLLALKHQLSSIAAPASAGTGLLVTSFLLEHTRTLSADPRDHGTDGWSPGTGDWKYWGYNGSDRSQPNPGNAYIRIFVNTADPTRALTQAQIDTLAYADCAADGMMGDDCMTGTTRAGYGTAGSMRGYPISQVITRK
ncbi:MAG: hypothetical protein Q4G70_11975 [Pseudomonadota bacterium]|nr:hypothetical protein [Pseudomonadota bacterium]